MKTYLFDEKNGSATIIISGENKNIARKYLKSCVIDPNEWRLSEVCD